MVGRATYELTAAASRADSRASDLYRRTREIHQLATIARDCAAPGTRDLPRAEMTLAKIAELASGGAL